MNPITGPCSAYPLSWQPPHINRLPTSSPEHSFPLHSHHIICNLIVIMPPAPRSRGRPKKFNPIERTTVTPKKERSETPPASGSERVVQNESRPKEAASGLEAPKTEDISSESESESTSTSTEVKDEDASSVAESVSQLPVVPPPAQSTTPHKAPKKPVGPGQREVYFQDNKEWQQHHEKQLGTKTRKLTFGSGFVLEE